MLNMGGTTRVDRPFPSFLQEIKVIEEIIRDGAGEKPIIIKEILEPDPESNSVKKKEKKKVHILE